MKYEGLLASRYIKAQKRQSFFTVISIAAAIAVMTMIFVLYSVCMDCCETTAYSSKPYHIAISNLTEEQGEALQNEDMVRTVKLERMQDGSVTAYVLFDSDIGDGDHWLQTTANKLGFGNTYIDKAYDWNTALMLLDSIGDGAHLFRLRIFCIFFIFAVFMALALRLIIDTAFEVSSKERERHYGVLQSVGATPEQIVRIITSEGMRLCVVAVPFGLIAGIGLAYLMYNVLLAAGLSDIFQGMTNAKLHLPFSVDPKMLLVAAVVGVVWVFLSAYGVGMRIIKKTPMEAITARADEVKKVRRHTLSGTLFGISGSIASRNARRQKKRFVITVLTLTVSITLFALFTTLADTVERSITALITGDGIGTDTPDFVAMLNDESYPDTSYEAGARELEESGLFRDISINTVEYANIADTSHLCYIGYMNRKSYEELFGTEPAVSYDELVSSGSYVCDISVVEEYSELAPFLDSDRLNIITTRTTVPVDKITEDMSLRDIYMLAETEKTEREIIISGKMSENNTAYYSIGSTLIGALETYQDICDDWYGNKGRFACASFSYYKENEYNPEDYKKAIDWFNEHADTVTVDEDYYGLKLRTHSIMSAVRAGVTLLNVLIAMAALINLLNIISTGIANRRSELASLQCVGMTDRQLYRMTMIECLQFAGAAAIISAIICAVVIFGTENAVSLLIEDTFVDESEKVKNTIKGLLRFDHITPFIRIAAASLTAFAAGCVTSLVMLRIQDKDSLSDQIRGSEMKLDTKKSHILRNSIIAVLSAVVITIAGLRTYSVVAYLQDRKEYKRLAISILWTQTALR